jgi:hypothetical protein
MGLLEGVTLEVRNPKACPRLGCCYCRMAPIALLLRDGVADPDATLASFLRRIVCKVCGQQPAELVLCDRADGQGWRVVVPVERWLRC